MRPSLALAGRVEYGNAAPLKTLDRLSFHPDSGARRPVFMACSSSDSCCLAFVFYRHGPGSDVVGVIGVPFGKRNIARKLLRGAS